MTNIGFVKKLKDVANNHNTTYVWGGTGVPITEATISTVIQRFPTQYTIQRQNHLRSLIGKNYFGFDCSGFIKAVLWGWYGNFNHSNGGAILNSNNIPDTNSSGLINLCNDISTDFTNISSGELIWRQGHVGIYIGNGKCVEAYDWAKPVEIRGVSNINNNIPGIRSTSWTKHGKIPTITYRDTIPISDNIINIESKHIIQRYTITTPTLNCRKTPSTNSPIVGTFNINHIVTGLEIKDNWIFVSDGLLTGWCSLQFLKEI